MYINFKLNKKSNKKINKIFLVTMVSIILVFYTSVCFANQLDKMDDAGNNVLIMIRRIGYWLIVIKATQEVIKSVMDGGTKNVGGIITKYIIMYGTLFALPWALRLVEGIFQ